MKSLKIYEGLSDYLLSEDGSVFNKATGEKVEPLKTKPLPQYLLTTDEFGSLFMNNNKFSNVRLKRRFTVEDITKMFKTPKAVVYVSEITSTISLKEENGIVTEAISMSVDAGEIKQPKQSTKIVTFQKKAEKAKKAKPAKTKATTTGLKLPYLNINGVDYQSARQASKALGVAVNTVLSKAKKNKDGFFFIEK